MLTSYKICLPCLCSANPANRFAPQPPTRSTPHVEARKSRLTGEYPSAQSGLVGETVHLPPALFQPIASDDVVAALAEVAVNPPVNDMVEVAGPEPVSMAGLVETFLRKTGDPRQVVADVNARYFGALLNDQSLTPGENSRIGSLSLEEWFSKFGPKMPVPPKAVAA